MVARVEEILSLLDSASDIGELNLPGCRLHALTGKLRGFWSVRVTGNWRTTSRFVNGEALDVDVVDHHYGGAGVAMKNPVHPGRIVRRAIGDLGVSVIDAAKALQVSRPALSNLGNGKSGLSPEMAVRLSKAIGSTPASWMRLQMIYDLAQIERRAQSIVVSPLAARDAA